MPPKGYTFPLTPDGCAGLVPPPPWQYSADFTLFEYRTNPDHVIALLPPELDPADDPGAVAVLFAEWQSCTDDLHELYDPAQSQYKEMLIVVGCSAATGRFKIWSYLHGQRSLDYDDTLEDLQAIAPKEMIKGYRFSFGYSVNGGLVIAQQEKGWAKP